METKRYYKLTKSENSALNVICAIAPLYCVDLNFELLGKDVVYTRKLAAIMIGYIGNDLRETSMRSQPGMFDAGFGLLSTYIKKISVLL